MISNLGKYIPLIFLIASVVIFLDSFIAFTVIHNISTDQTLISQTYQKIYNTHGNSPKELALVQQYKNAFTTSINHIYGETILSALLTLCLLIFAYVVIMQELRQRSLLEQKKNDFISLASHELKTPITSISVFTQLLAKNIPKNNRQMRFLLRKMENQVMEMNNLINDLLDITRIQLGKLELHKEYINLPEYIKEIIEEIAPTTKKHKITFQGPAGVEVFADKQRIWQVIANLLTNAIKYSPQGDGIQVRLEKKITRVVVSIKDRGIGISKENQEHIFDRYFREETVHHGNVSGLGLGLFLARQIVLLHGGRIWVKSDPGKGATFSFTLPFTLSPRSRKKDTSPARE